MNTFLKYAKKVLFTLGQFLWVLVKSIFVSFGVAIDAAIHMWTDTN